MPSVAHVEMYGKGVVVKGDTREIKDDLKGLGGKWNPKLVGWMFPGSKKDTILQALRSNAKVETVVDRTGSSSSAAPAAPAAAETAQPAKREVTQQEDDDGGIVFPIEDLLRVTVNIFMGMKGVDIRRYYHDKGSSKVLPTAKGVRLNVKEWESLQQKFSEIDAAPASEDNRIEIESDSKDPVFVTKKDNGVDVRKFYTDKNDGEKKPTKKGCSLQQAHWNTLKGLAAKITEALGNTLAASSPKKKQRTEKQTPAASSERGAGDSTGDGGPPSPKDLKKSLKDLLKGKDLGAITLKSVRAELETKLSLPEGGLNARKDEIKDIITAIVQYNACGKKSE